LHGKDIVKTILTAKPAPAPAAHSCCHQKSDGNMLPPLREGGREGRLGWAGGAKDAKNYYYLLCVLCVFAVKFFPDWRKRMTYEEILRELKKHANKANVEGMARFGINPKGTLGLSMPTLRTLAKRIGTNHDLAGRLWRSGIHEARILAALIDDPAQVTPAQMESWIKDFDSWDVCDQVCGNLFDRTRFARRKAVVWTKKNPEYERRAGFALMAALAWHDKDAKDEMFLEYLPVIERYAFDERNFVKKAVNWALRNIGKRNLALNKAAVACARRIAKQNSRAARWIAKDALRELMNPKTIARIKK
jgi:3-methyladenine DNA glycosylase AlkD